METLTRKRIAQAIAGGGLAKKDQSGWYEIEVEVTDGYLITVTIHNYTGWVARMTRFLRKQGYHLLNVHAVNFESCADGREFWWVKEE